MYNATAVLVTYIMCMALMFVSGMPYAWRQFVYIYTVKVFIEVDETIGSSVLRCVLVGYASYVRVSFKT